MNEKNFAFSINHDSDIPKYQQLVNTINNAIAEQLLEKGDLLPSVNSICKNSTSLKKQRKIRQFFSKQRI